MKDFYELVRPLQPEALKDQNGSPAIQTNAEKAAAEEPLLLRAVDLLGSCSGRRTDDANEYQRHTDIDLDTG